MKRKLMFGAFALVAAGLAMSIAAPKSVATPSPFDVGYGQKYYPDFATWDEAKDHAKDVNIQIMEESFVLLKNNQNALPLARGEGVTLMSNNSYHYCAGGSGSGSGAGVVIPLQDALENDGIKINRLAEKVYEPIGQKYQHTASSFGSSSTMYYPEPVEEVADKITDSLDLYGTVIWTIGRYGGEGNDLAVHEAGNNEITSTYYADKSKHYLQLSTNEEKMLAYLKEQKALGRVSKIVVLLNTANPFELGELEIDDDIDAMAWVGQPGGYGLVGTSHVLTGKVAPSGRTVDIWAKNMRLDPVWQNFTDNVQFALNEDGTANNQSEYYGNTAYTGSVEEPTQVRNTAMVEYEEGIYMGYRYYETADAEAKAGNYEGFSYEEQVLYPFGYGLSYTEFEQKIVTPAAEIEEAINNAANGQSKIYVDVEVKNVGKVAGKEVVQIYNHAPYTKGGIEKAEVTLAGFEKTSLLRPGQSEVVKVEIRIQDLASFDYNDKNTNEYKGYELEAGKYELRLQKNSHECIDKVELNLEAKTSALDNDDNAENNTLFSNGDDFDTMIHTKNGENHATMKVMSRADMKGTFPTAPKHEDRIVSDYVASLMTNQSRGVAGAQVDSQRYNGPIDGTDDKETDPWYKRNEDIPAGWTQSVDGSERVGGKTAVQLKEMIGVDYFDTTTVLPEGHPYAGKTHAEAWELFMNQLTLAELKTLNDQGGYRSPGLASVGKDQATDQDGPGMLKSGSGNIHGFNFAANINVASTWNMQLTLERGRCTGNDSLFSGSTGWYAPSVNTHRSPFSGRNFEYYSEDGLLAGKIAAMDVIGFQSKGGYAFIKHFALNDMETSRIGVSTFADEQAIRELHTKSFEYTIREGDAHAIMSSFNRIGAIPASGNWASITGLLRNEWGFHGEIVTDYFMGTSSMTTGNMAIRAGAQLHLNGNWGALGGDWDASLRDGKGGVRFGVAEEGVVPESPTQYYALRMGAMYVLWVGAQSNVMHNGYDLSQFANQTITLVKGMSANAKIDVDLEKLGTDAVSFSAASLPAGLTLSSDGTIGGTPSVSGSTRVNVNLNADIWINRSAQVTFNVIEPLEIVDSEEGRTVKLVDQIELSETAVTTADEVGASSTTASLRSVSGLPEGLSLDLATGLISGETEETDYRFTVTVRIAVSTVSTNWWGQKQVRTTNTDIPVTFTIGRPAAEPTPEVTLSGVSVNGEGHLIARYSDGSTQDLGLVKGEDGSRGLEGFDGKDGEDGVGIASFEAAKENGVTVVTITLTNGEVVSFEIADGLQGEKGDKGDTGEKGADGAAGKDGKDGEAAKGGCGGSIIATSAILTTAALGFAGLAIAKKRKEDK